jgi:hypothetical protein
MVTKHVLRRRRPDKRPYDNMGLRQVGRASSAGVTLFLFLGSAVAGALASSQSLGAAQSQGPNPTEVLPTRSSPRSGSAFPGVVIATLEDGARLYRAVHVTCGPGSVRRPGARPLQLRPRTLRFPRRPDAGGAVRLVTQCTWDIPPASAGRKLEVRVLDTYVNQDGTSSRGSETLEWVIR